MSQQRKRAILARAIEQLEAKHAAMVAAAERARVEATHEEARPENDKDTRALEMSYLARGQAMRTEELAETLERLRHMELPVYGPDDAVGVGALVLLEDEEETKRVLLVPAGGGLEVEAGKERALLLTPAAPLGRALMDQREGDEIEVRVAGRLRCWELVEVS